MRFFSKRRAPSRQAQPGHSRTPPALSIAETLESRQLLSVSLLKNIHLGTQSSTSSPDAIVGVGDTAFFTVSGQLWASDGTAGGTRLLSTLASGVNTLTPAGDRLYFLANHPSAGQELWISDGTGTGTRLVKDVRPGGAWSNIRWLTRAGETVFFAADNGINGVELWRTDGTENGTSMVRDIATASGASADVRTLAALGDTLLFAADDGVHGYELWRSDGTFAGTQMVRDIFVGAHTSGLGNLTTVGGAVLFSANAGSGGYELWRSDGTSEGTYRLKEINSGLIGSSPALFTNVNGTLFFSAYTGSTGDELWKSDGTEAGTVLVRDMAPGTTGSGIEDPIAVGNRLFFRMHTPTLGSELWTSDGTAAGTTVVKDIIPGAWSAQPSHFAAVGNTLFFRARDTVSGYELWKSDGTAAGTTMVADLFPGGGGASPAPIAAVGASVFFTASAPAGPRLFRSDGTSTEQVATFSTSTFELGSHPANITAFAGAVYFSATSEANGTELWRTDGAAGTALLKDIVPGPGSSNPASFKVVGSTMFFTAAGTLWKSDGTDVGTVQVSAAASNPHGFTVIGGVLHFLATTGAHGEELWRSDGSAAGTVRLTDINPGSGNSRISQLVDWNGRPYFVANDGVRGDEIWTTGATLGDAVLLADLAPGSTSSGPWSLTPLGDTMYFRASDGGGVGWELWKTDGSAAGTQLVKDIFPGSENSGLFDLTAHGGLLYFTANDGIHGFELWRSDGTAGGTALFMDLNPGDHGSSPAALVSYNGALYFRATDGVHGSELWRSDGTTAGTAMVKDLRTGIAPAVPHDFAVVNGLLTFRARSWGGDGLWMTDGLSDELFAVIPEVPSPDPGSFAYLNGKVIFGAARDAGGTELWSADFGTTSQSATLASPGPSYTTGTTALPTGRSSTPATPQPPATSIASAVVPWSTPRVATTHASGVLAESSTSFLPAAQTEPVIYDGLIDFGNIRPSTPSFGTEPAWVTVWGILPNDEPYRVTDVPDEAAVRILAAEVVDNRNGILVSDIEWWPIDVRVFSDGLVQVYIERFTRIADWLHDERPTIKMGFYANMPVGDFFTPASGQPGPLQQWQAASARLQPIADKVDIIFPSLYTFFEDRVQWQAFANRVLEQAATYGKPVSPFVWMQYHQSEPDTALRLIPADYWRIILNAARSNGNSLTLWGGFGPWNEQSAWWAVTRDVIAEMTAFEPERPAVIQGSFLPGPRQLSVAFNKDVQASLATGDLRVTRHSDGAELVPSLVGYDAQTQTATFQFAEALADGGYSALIPAAGVADAAATPMQSAYVQEFFAGPPLVTSIGVNDGNPQRSMIRKLTVVFDRPVIIGSDAFSLVGRNGAGNDTNVQWSQAGEDGRTYELTFDGASVVGGSLADGIYDLTILASGVRDLLGTSPDDDVVLAFHRLYSDVDGDGDSDNADLFQMRAAYGKFEGDAAYRWWWDHDADGDVDNADVFQVRSRRTVTFKDYQ